jgi:hypothetical protein
MVLCDYADCVIVITSCLYSESKLNVAVQVSDLENGSWESDCKFVVELDGARKAIKHKEVSWFTSWIAIIHKPLCSFTSQTTV